MYSNINCINTKISMEILDDNKLEKLCNLAKLKISQQEKTQFLKKMNTVFEWMEQLSKIDVSNVNLNDIQTTDSVYEREDRVIVNNTREEVLSNTKHKKFNMIQVPKVVG